jgi:putative ABC transport system permease protein
MANTMAMTVRERTKEVGTLKALGFQRGTIAGLFLGEALLVTTISALIGIAGARVLFGAVDLSLVVPQAPFQSFVPTGSTLAFAFLVSLLVGIVSVSYSAVRVSGMTIAEALRSTE